MNELIEKNEVTVFITGQCNSNCIMCPCSDYERRNKTGITDEEISDLISNLKADTDYVVITGGEPTLKTEQFFMVMRQLADRFPNVEMLVLTNGRSFASSKMVERLIDHCPPLLTMAIPIHGDTMELHDRITRSPGSFNQTRLGIRNLLSVGVAIEIRIVVSKLNYQSLERIAEMVICEMPNVRIVNFISLETMGNCARYFKDVYIDLDNSFQSCKPAVERLIYAGIDVGLYNYPLCAVDRRFWSLCKKSISSYKVRFQEACKECAVRQHCGGFFSSTLSLAKPPVRPIVDGFSPERHMDAKPFQL